MFDSRIVNSQRGIALPMALIALLALSALVIAFATLSATEPTIANNQRRVAEARAVAEAGIERIVWALNNPTASGGLNHVPPAAFPSPVPVPYDNSSAIALSVGGTQLGVFRVTATAGTDPATGTPDPWRVNVNSVGWVPTDNAGDSRTKAHQRIQATVMKLRNIAGDARCALCVRGDLEVWGTSVVDSRPAAGDSACGSAEAQLRPGTFTTGDTSFGGAARIYGSNQPSTGPSDYNREGTETGGPYDVVQPDPTNTSQTQQFQDAFDAFKLKNYELDALRALAKARGTYFQGTVTFNSSNQLPDGIVFIDTVSGQNITDSTPVGDFASVDINGNAGSGPENTFNGWIIVNGSLSISGNVKLNGLVYATNDISYAGTGTGRIEGQMISANIRDTVATQVYDSTTTGNSLIRMNCAYVRNGGGGQVPQTWFVQAGSYKERGD